MTDVTYPALVFPFGGRTVVVAVDGGLFAQATRSQLKAGFFEAPLRIVDFLGFAFAAENLHECGGLGAFGGWNIFLNRTIRIELSFRPLGPLSVHEVRELVKSALQDDPTGIWAGGEFAPDTLSKKIGSCSAVSEVIGVLSS